MRTCQTAVLTARVTSPSRCRAGGCARTSPSPPAGRALRTGLSTDSSRGSHVTAANGLGRREGPSRPPMEMFWFQPERDRRQVPTSPPAPAASCCSPARELGQRRLVPCRRVPTPTRDWTGRGSGPEAFGDAVRSVHPPTLDCFHTPVSSAIERRGEGKGEPCQQWTGLFFTLLSFYFSLWQEKVS